MTLAFLVSKIFFYTINKIIHGCLWTWNFSSRVQLDISLVRCAHSLVIELNTRREIPYLHAPMYYSLFIVLFNILLHIFFIAIVNSNDDAPIHILLNYHFLGPQTLPLL